MVTTTYNLTLPEVDINMQRRTSCIYCYSDICTSGACLRNVFHCLLFVIL